MNRVIYESRAINQSVINLLSKFPNILKIHYSMVQPIKFQLKLMGNDRFY